MESFTFTNAWFEDQKPYHVRFLSEFDTVSTPIHILEIGCYEGRSTVFFTQYLQNNESSLTCIDPFMEGDKTSPMYKNIYDTFRHNVKLTGHRINLYKEFSNTALLKLLISEKKFDYILIDGSHVNHHVAEDAVLAWRLLKPNGIMFFDDYNNGVSCSAIGPTVGIRSFLNAYNDVCEVLHTGYHLVLRKKSE